MTMNLRHERLLVIAPHADDETAGAGGLISRVKADGGKAFVMVMSVGDLDHFTGTRQRVHGSQRANELAAAMKTLGADDFDIVMTDSNLHMRLDTLPRRDLVNLIESGSRLATEKTKPTIMVLPAPSFNQDHEAVFKAGMTACRPHLAKLKAFQRLVLVADAPQLAWGKERFFPNFYVDISGIHLQKKLQAFACHKSQLRPSPHQGAVDALRLLAESRGREISVEAAEAYESLRAVL
ncbi:MAG: PIG-L deacetylase family protein [Planctomycetota bacterium]|nr:PIG-L deacetylase family protein [Planctomycetota bacterium]